MPKTKNARWSGKLLWSTVAWRPPRLLWKDQPSDGFTTLWELKRLDLSVEAYVLRPEHAPLFTEE